MTNSFYNASGTPGTGTFAASAPMRSEFSNVAAGFDKLPTLSAGNALKALVVNSGGTAITTTTGTLALAGDFATTGAFSTTLVAGANVSLTLPVVSGTLATLAGTETLSNKTLVAPALGTPVSGVATNLTGTAAGLTAGSVTTNANLTGPITSIGNATSVASQTGTGSTFVMNTSPTLVTPTLGVATATSVNGLGITTTTGTLTLTNGKTLSVAKTLTLDGTDGTTMTFPSTSATVARTDAGQTFTGVQTFSTPIAASSLATMTATVGGAVPTPPNNTTTFLRGDGTFAAPGGGTGTVTSVSVVTANGVSGSVATATTTPAITLTLGAITPTTVNGLTISTSTGTLTIANGKTATVSNTLTLTATDGSTLAIGAGGTLDSAAYKATGTSGNTVPLLDGANTWSAGQTFSAAITYGGVTLSNAVTGTGNMALSASPTFTGTLTASAVASAAHVITSPSANALVVGPNGATAPVLQVDASTGSQAAGLKITGAATGGTVALAAIDSGGNCNLSIDAKGTGTITLGGTSTGAITLTRATTLSAALTYGGTALSNSVTGTGSMVLSASPALTGSPTAPTQSASDNSTKIATTAYVDAAVAARPRVVAMAKFNPGGTISTQYNVTSIMGNGTGGSIVNLTSNIDANAVISVTLGENANGGEVVVSAQGASSITIQAYDSSGTPADFDFYHVVAYA